MRSTGLVMAALGCGFIASLGVYQYLRAASGTGTEARTILVATKEITINQPLTGENVRAERWASRQIPQGSLADLNQIEGKYARIRLYPGEPILAAKVMNWDDATSSLKVPQGFRAVSVKVSMDSSVSSLIEPGDKVDVIVVMKRSQETPPMSKTILTAVQVFAVNTEMAREPEKDKTLEEVRTVSLLLNPEQAEKLAMGQELGTVRLTLRSPDDPLVDETPGCTVDRLFGRGEAASSVDELSPSELRELPEPTTAGPAAPARWSMVIETPLTSEVYAFDAAGRSPKLAAFRDKTGREEPWTAPPEERANQPGFRGPPSLTTTAASR
jgi:pilus assembly protein CpaB